MEKDNYIYWKCSACGNVYKSNRLLRHNMNFCKCGQSGVDAEELYSRYIGKVQSINKELYDYFKDSDRLPS
jgi:hypothetical protein